VCVCVREIMCECVCVCFVCASAIGCMHSMCVRVFVCFYVCVYV